MSPPLDDAPIDGPSGFIVNRTHSRKEIGQLLREELSLSTEQIRAIVEFQQANGILFGQAAVALKISSDEDVLRALARQFSYTYPSADTFSPLELPTLDDPFGVQAEAFRELVSRLTTEAESLKCEGSVLGVISASVADGKTYIASNVAVALSQTGRRVLLIDGDLRTPQLHRLFHTGRYAGVSDILAGFADVTVIQALAQIPNLHLLSIGTLPPNPLELWQKPTLRHLINQLVRRFDAIIIDTPAASHGSDWKMIASICTSAILVSRRGHSQIRFLEEIVHSLKALNTHISGTVTNEYSI